MCEKNYLSINWKSHRHQTRGMEKKDIQSPVLRSLLITVKLGLKIKAEKA
jgi:hypothetical protein